MQSIQARLSIIKIVSDVIDIRALILYRRRRFINHLLTYLHILTYCQIATNLLQLQHFAPHKTNKNRYHQTCFLGSKMRLRPMLCPGPRWGSLQRSPRPFSCIKGAAGRDVKGGEGERGKRERKREGTKER